MSPSAQNLHSVARAEGLTDVQSSWAEWMAQALVAQRIRASDYGSEGREFESLQARLHQKPKAASGRFFFGSIN
jgi:hypothetical protein